MASLPEIAAVVTQGGDGYGAAQAFKAAGRPTPLIIMGNRQDELQWWKEQKDANGYETMSVSIAPGVSTLAFWVAQQVLDGADVPKDLARPSCSSNVEKDSDDASIVSSAVWENPLLPHLILKGMESRVWLERERWLPDKVSGKTCQNVRSILNCTAVVKPES